MTVTVPLPVDEAGYLDRACPSSACKAPFKVFGEDWEAKVCDEAVYCPMCRHEQSANDWMTKAQREHVVKHAEAHVQQFAHQEMAKIAREFNSGWSSRS